MHTYLKYFTANKQMNPKITPINRYAQKEEIKLYAVVTQCKQLWFCLKMKLGLQQIPINELRIASQE